MPDRPTKLSPNPHVVLKLCSMVGDLGAVDPSRLQTGHEADLSEAHHDSRHKPNQASERYVNKNVLQMTLVRIHSPFTRTIAPETVNELTLT